MIANALAGLQALDRGLEPIGRNWESLVSWGSEGQSCSGLDFKGMSPA